MRRSQRPKQEKTESENDSKILSKGNSHPEWIQKILKEWFEVNKAVSINYVEYGGHITLPRNFWAMLITSPGVCSPTEKEIIHLPSGVSIKPTHTHT